MPRAVGLAIYIAMLVTGPLALFLLPPAWVPYRVTERYAFEGGAPGTPVHLAVILPRSRPYQRVESLDVRWAGTVARQSDGALDVIRLEGILPESGRQEAVLAYQVVLRQGRLRWEGPVEAQQLAPESEIESDAGPLVEQAARIASGQSREDAYRIYAFVAGYLSWPSGSRMGGGASALGAYETGVGVCGEFANLTTALARAAGIAARSMSGLMMPLSLPYITRSKTWLHPAGSHAWTEMYAGEGWEIADASWASRMPWNRLWFGRALGTHLSYGDTGELARVYDEITAWAQEQGKEIGSMSAPLRLAAAADGEGVTVQPVAQVTGGADVRCLRAGGLYVTMVVGFSLLERRWRPGKRGKGAGQPMLGGSCASLNPQPCAKTGLEYTLQWEWIAGRQSADSGPTRQGSR